MHSQVSHRCLLCLWQGELSTSNRDTSSSSPRSEKKAQGSKAKNESGLVNRNNDSHPKERDPTTVEGEHTEAQNVDQEVKSKKGSSDES